MHFRRRRVAITSLPGAISTGSLHAGDMLEWDGELAPNLNWPALSGSTTNWDPDSIPDLTSDCIAVLTSRPTNGGRVRPGPAERTGFARFHVSDEYVQPMSGELAISIAGETRGQMDDILEIEGDTTVAGTLAITLSGDDEPEPATAFMVAPVRGDTITGGIDTIDAPGRWTVDVQPSSIIAIDEGPDIPGDVDGDGMVAFGDLLSVRSAVGPGDDCGDCPPDVNEDCTVDVDGILVVLAAWS